VKKKKNVLEEGVFLTSALPEATQIAYVKILRSPVGGKSKEAKGIVYLGTVYECIGG